MDRKNKVVLIDDNKDYLFTMETFLTKNGFEVSTAEDGQSGVKLVENEKPDIVLLDVMMESLFSGFEVCRKLRQNSDLKSIPIIGISGMADEINVKFDKKKDFDYFSPEEFLEKPVDKELLLETINKLINKT